VRTGALGLLLLLGACSAEPASDVPPLPKENADSANALMREAEQAAQNAGERAEPKPSSARSAPETSNEVRQ